MFIQKEKQKRHVFGRTAAYQLMATALVRKNNILIQHTLLLYGILPLLLVCLFFSIHALMPALQAGNDQTGAGAASGIFVGSSVFSGTISVTGNEDVVNSVVIPAGHSSAYVAFQGIFTRTPAIVLSVTDPAAIDAYFVEEVSPEGFMVVLNPVQPSDTRVTYRATDAVKRSVSVTRGLKSERSIRIHDTVNDALIIASSK